MFHMYSLIIYNTVRFTFFLQWNLSQMYYKDVSCILDERNYIIYKTSPDSLSVFKNNGCPK